MTATGHQVTILIPESDYRYGVGDLRLRVERIDRANPVPFDGEPWYTVQGMQVSASGVEVRRREVVVRGRRLPPLRPVTNRATPP